MEVKKKAKLAILTSDQVDFKTKTTARDKKSTLRNDRHNLEKSKKRT